MSSFNADLKAHLAGEVTTVCTCWIIRPSGKEPIGFTNHDNDLLIEGISCKAATGFESTEAMSQLGLPVDDQEIEGVLSSEAISQRDLKLGLYNDARVETWMVNWCNTQQRQLRRVALLGNVSMQDGRFQAELRGMTSLLDRENMRTYSRQCNALLGDGRCGVDVSASQFRAEGQIDGVLGRLRFKSTILTNYPKDWFLSGTVEWVSGDNVGVVNDLSAAGTGVDDELSLLLAPPLPIQDGDHFVLTAGCDKSFQTCRSKFSNGVNFRGHPHIPGSDFALGYAVRDANHNGGPLVD
ncbi:MAG: DUF2163 domain-containing protein [Pseudomonadota bacterium]